MNGAARTKRPPIDRLFLSAYSIGERLNLAASFFLQLKGQDEKFNDFITFACSCRDIIFLDQ